MRVFMIVPVEPVIITDRFETVTTAITIAILHPGQLGLLHDNKLVSLVILNPDSKALVSPLCEFGPFIIPNAPDPSSPRSNHHGPILGHGNPSRLKKLVSSINVLGRFPVLERISGRKFHFLFPRLILVAHHGLLSPVLLLGHVRTAHQWLLQFCTERVSLRRSRLQSPLAINQLPTSHLDIAQPLL